MIHWPVCFICLFLLTFSLEVFPQNKSHQFKAKSQTKVKARALKKMRKKKRTPLVKQASWWERYGENWKWQAEAATYPTHPHFQDSFLLRSASTIKGKINPIQFKLGIKGQWQQDQGTGKAQANYLDLKDTSISTNYGDFYLAIGHLNVIWGRLDGMSPNNKFSREDLTRPFELQEDRLLGQTLVRGEYYQGAQKWELIWIPDTWPHRLPTEEGPWFPLDRPNALIQGMGKVTQMAPLLAIGKIVERRQSRESAGISYAGEYQGKEWAIHYMRYTDLLPFFHLNESFLTEQASGGFMPLLLNKYAAQMLIKEYRQHQHYGMDFATDLNGIIWRTEIAYSTEHYVTSNNFFPKKVDKIEYGQSWEYSPDSFNLNTNFQINGQYLLGTGFLEARHQCHISGRVQALLAREIFLLEGIFSYSVFDQSSMIMPKILYKGWKNLETYLYYVNFNGNLSSVWGFFDKHDLYGLGIKGHF